MNVHYFIEEVKNLEKWLWKHDYEDLPIEIFDKRGEKIEMFNFSIDLDRDVIEINK